MSKRGQREKRYKSYEVVDKEECPLSAGGWRKLFDVLPLDRAVKFTCNSRRNANFLGISISSALRVSRVPYKVHYRITNEEDVILMYVWKEERKEELP